MWEQVKRAVVDSAREVCGSERMEVKNIKNAWWNDVVKAAVERNEAPWKEVLGARGEVPKDRCIEMRFECVANKEDGVS